MLLGCLGTSRMQYDDHVGALDPIVKGLVLLTYKHAHHDQQNEEGCDDEIIKHKRSQALPHVCNRHGFLSCASFPPCPLLLCAVSHLVADQRFELFESQGRGRRLMSVLRTQQARGSERWTSAPTWCERVTIRLVRSRRTAC